MLRKGRYGDLQQPYRTIVDEKPEEEEEEEVYFYTIQKILNYTFEY